jgi:hypothetical protein
MLCAIFFTRCIDHVSIGDVKYPALPQEFSDVKICIGTLT